MGFDRLAALASTVTGQDPLSGHLFAFHSRRGDRLKILVWERDGFVLWHKRLEEGTFRLPKIDPASASVELRASELAMLLDGIDLRTVRRGSDIGGRAHKTAAIPLRSNAACRTTRPWRV